MRRFGAIAAIFDLDDSLLDGNAGTFLTWHLLTERLLRADVRQSIPRTLYDYARKRKGEADMVSFASRAHVGMRADVLKDEARVCFERHLQHRITAEGAAAVRHHLLSGHLVVLASGSPQAIVDEVGRHLHVHVSMGTRSRIVNGVHTDELVLPLTFQSGKRERVLEVCGLHDLDLSRSYLYSDSVADTPLFESVGNPVVINPKPGFRIEAVRRGWEIRSWRRRRASELEHAHSDPGLEPPPEHRPTGADGPGLEWMHWDG